MTSGQVYEFIKEKFCDGQNRKFDLLPPSQILLGFKPKDLMFYRFSLLSNPMDLLAYMRPISPIHPRDLRELIKEKLCGECKYELLRTDRPNGTAGNFELVLKRDDILIFRLNSPSTPFNLVAHLRPIEENQPLSNEN